MSEKNQNSDLNFALLTFSIISLGTSGLIFSPILISYTPKLTEQTSALVSEGPEFHVTACTVFNSVCQHSLGCAEYFAPGRDLADPSLCGTSHTVIKVC